MENRVEMVEEKQTKLEEWQINMSKLMDEEIKQKEGLKYDQNKLRLDLIPPEAIEALGKVLTYGAAKYGDSNWKKGMRWGRIYAALQRHLLAWHGSRDIDSESGLPHLYHALANLTFLIYYTQKKIGKDTRD